jgi:VIT1/CCC1 family predicted Fe2+/Mn2+ transporter
MADNPVPPPADVQEAIAAAQQGEITEHVIYRTLAKQQQEEKNRAILERIAAQELEHYNVWARHTGRSMDADRWRVARYLFLARVFGITFTLKLMERGEAHASTMYRSILGSAPEAAALIADEEEHEKQLLQLIDEERLRYMGSVVLGLSDALVELTGTLAGLSFALQNTQLIAVAGLITGIAAALSMSASEYLSTKTETGEGDPAKAAAYTGCAYILTVLLLVSPFFIVASYLTALLCTIADALIIIFVFTYYLSIARDLPFRARFVEMVVISMGVAGASFVIGLLVRVFLNIQI